MDNILLSVLNYVTVQGCTKIPFAHTPNILPSIEFGISCTQKQYFALIHHTPHAYIVAECSKILKLHAL